MAENEEAKLSVRNRLTDKITRIQIGTFNIDIGGAVLSAVIANERCEEEGLNKEQKVMGLIKASAEFF